MGGVKDFKIIWLFPSVKHSRVNWLIYIESPGVADLMKTDLYVIILFYTKIQVINNG